MSKMREAFEKWAGREHYRKPKFDAFEAGYQAAIADVKADGVSCYMGTYNEHDIWYMRTVVMLHKESFEPTPDRVVPLYNLPEDV